MWCQFLIAAIFAFDQAAATQPAAPPDILPFAPRPPYRFNPEEEALLDEIQRAAFDFFWKEVGDPVPLAKDRMKGPVASIASVGFQLSAYCIGAERGWAPRQQCADRCAAILRGLLERSDNKKDGVYLHFPDLNTAGLSHEGYEITASTVDHALLLAGALTAGAYFKGEVAQLADRMAHETNWKAFALPNGFISMGWRPDDPAKMNGSGKLLEWHWWCASDEERLVYFLAAGSPNPAYAVDPALYYRLKREVRQHRDLPGYVVSWPGTLFTYFFSHCWIDYRGLEADDPSLFGQSAPRVDWFENSRRAMLTHHQRCIEMAPQFKTLSAERWGLSACAARDGYIVPGLRPNLSSEENWFEGTVAPYAAASAIMFTPKESLAALRAFRDLRRGDKAFIWRDRAEGGYGFVDSFNLDQDFASDDYVGIDVGPTLLAIENARSGLIWKTFMSHPVARTAAERLKLKNSP